MKQVLCHDLYGPISRTDTFQHPYASRNSISAGLYLVQGILIELDRPVSHAYVCNKSLLNGLHQQIKQVVASKQLGD